MSYGVKIRVWGDYACFTRPEMKVERYSYDVMTPSAARNILQAIYWHPGMEWIIDKIHVINPIAFTTVRRNEVKSKISKQNALNVMNGGSMELSLNAEKDISQRASIVLKNVDYVIEAHFLITERANSSDNVGKFLDIFNRRLRKGQCFTQPYLGCKEFVAHFEPFDDEYVDTHANKDRDLGMMLYDMDYKNKDNISIRYFRARLKNGTIDLRNCEVY